MNINLHTSSLALLQDIIQKQLEKRLKVLLDAYYQLTDQEIKEQIMNYVPLGYRSVSDFEWIIFPYNPKCDNYSDL